MYIQTSNFVKAAFFLEGFSTTQFKHKKTNKQSKAGIMIKLTKNLVIIAGSLLTRYWI